MQDATKKTAETIIAMCTDYICDLLDKKTFIQNLAMYAKLAKENYEKGATNGA